MDYIIVGVKPTPEGRLELALDVPESALIRITALLRESPAGELWVRLGIDTPTRLDVAAAPTAPPPSRIRPDLLRDPLSEPMPG